MSKIRLKDIVYKAECGCVITLYANTEYYEYRYDACNQHADRWNTGREPIIAAAKAAVEKVVQRG